MKSSTFCWCGITARWPLGKASSWAMALGDSFLSLKSKWMISQWCGLYLAAVLVQIQGKTFVICFPFFKHSSYDSQDKRLVGVSPLCVHLSVRCHAYLVSFNFNYSSYKGYSVSVNCSCNLVFSCRPEGPMYQMFRSQFLAFSIYQSKSSEYFQHTWSKKYFLFYCIHTVFELSVLLTKCDVALVVSIVEYASKYFILVTVSISSHDIMYD